jgi:hypothetical protein
VQKNVVIFLLLFALVVANVVQVITGNRLRVAIERDVHRLSMLVEAREAAAGEYQNLRERLGGAYPAQPSPAESRLGCPPGCVASNEVAPSGEPRDRAKPAGTEDEKPAPRPEAVKAVAEGRKLVDQGLARGAWTSDDVYQLKRWMSDMESKDREEIMRRLIGSVNDGKLRPPPNGMLFWRRLVFGATSPSYVYFVSDGYGPVRYDTLASYTAASSWTTVDLSSVAPHCSLDGAVFDGEFLYFGCFSHGAGKGAWIPRFDARTPPALPDLPAHHGSFY